MFHGGAGWRNCARAMLRSSSCLGSCFWSLHLNKPPRDHAESTAEEPAKQSGPLEGAVDRGPRESNARVRDRACAPSGRAEYVRDVGGVIG
jgi:hypothetical protein